MLGQRFDFATFDPADARATKGTWDELGHLASLQSIANERATIGMFGAGYIEMLAREMTADLRTVRDSLARGQSKQLVTKGVHFGILSRSMDGRWDVTRVEGLPYSSLVSAGPASPPDLIIRPFHQAGRVVSLREFSNNAFNHHHGIQSTERFGHGTDPDGDGFRDEMTRADVTAVSVFQAALPALGRVIPRDRTIEDAIRVGEQRFSFDRLHPLSYTGPATQCDGQNLYGASSLQSGGKSPRRRSTGIQRGPVGWETTSTASAAG